ncbi:MAG TPA: rod shape-determining protein MreD [Acidimicrobiales bacterium]|nr:rod shape-determining protein MreD [Acidimicrobiales bacterium]
MKRTLGRTALDVVIVLFVGIVVQTTFANDLRVHEVAPDFMLLLAVMAGFAAGPDAGALLGFSAGLVNDMFLQGTPVGLSALAACLVGYAVGWLRSDVLRARLAFVPVVAAAGTLAGVFVFVVLGYIVGQAQLVAPGKRWLAEQAVVEAGFAAIFSLPAYMAWRWALRGPSTPASGLGEVTTAGIAETRVRRPASAPRARRRRARVAAR